MSMMSPESTKSSDFWQATSSKKNAKSLKLPIDADDFFLELSREWENEWAWDEY